MAAGGRGGRGSEPNFQASVLGHRRDRCSCACNDDSGVSPCQETRAVYVQTSYL